MKLMRADKRDAIVAAALYSAMLTFGVTYGLDAMARYEEQCRHQQIVKYMEDRSNYVSRAYSECIHREVKKQPTASTSSPRS